MPQGKKSDHKKLSHTGRRQLRNMVGACCAIFAAHSKFRSAARRRCVHCFGGKGAILPNMEPSRRMLYATCSSVVGIFRKKMLLVPRCSFRKGLSWWPRQKHKNRREHKKHPTRSYLCSPKQENSDLRESARPTPDVRI